MYKFFFLTIKVEGLTHTKVFFLKIHGAFSMSVPEAAVFKSSVRIRDAVGLVIPNCKLKLAEISLNFRGFAHNVGDWAVLKRTENKIHEICETARDEI